MAEQRALNPIKKVIRVPGLQAFLLGGGSGSTLRQPRAAMAAKPLETKKRG